MLAKRWRQGAHQRRIEQDLQIFRVGEETSKIISEGNDQSGTTNKDPVVINFCEVLTPHTAQDSHTNISSRATGCFSPALSKSASRTTILTPPWIILVSCCPLVSPHPGFAKHGLCPCLAMSSTQSPSRESSPKLHE